MKYFIIGVAVLFLVVFAVSAFPQKDKKPAAKARNAAQTLPIRVVIPFSTAPEFDPNRFAEQVSSTWKTSVVCEEGKSGNESGNEATFMAGDSANRVKIRLLRTPMPTDLVKRVVDENPYLDESDKNALRKSKGAIALEYVEGSAPPVDRAKFIGQLLLSILRHPQALGYVNGSAHLYRTRTECRQLVKLNALEAEAVYLLFIGMHLVDEGAGSWLHIHGMEQFGAPDLQVRFKGKGPNEYYAELITSAAVYMMVNGPVLQAGHTADLAGDGIIYRVQKGRQEHEDEFGAFGSLKFTQK